MGRRARGRPRLLRLLVRWMAMGLDALVALLFAPACAVCEQLLDRPTRGCVCPACWSSVPLLTPPFCARCGDAIARSGTECPRCRRGAPAIDVARAAGIHGGPMRGIVHAFKFGKRRSLAGPLARLMTEQAGELLTGVDWIVPVPLHRRRLRQRGFNQADDLARALARRTAKRRAVKRTTAERGTLGLGHARRRAEGRDAMPRARVRAVLTRVRDTRPQSDLPAARRHRNVRNAFATRGRGRGRRVSALAGRCVLLVDDVCTTGATLEACARVLKAAGAREVRALTAARAVRTPRVGSRAPPLRASPHR